MPAGGRVVSLQHRPIAEASVAQDKTEWILLGVPEGQGFVKQRFAGGIVGPRGEPVFANPRNAAAGGWFRILRSSLKVIPLTVIVGVPVNPRSLVSKLKVPPVCVSTRALPGAVPMSTEAFASAVLQAPPRSVKCRKRCAPS